MIQIFEKERKLLEQYRSRYVTRLYGSCIDKLTNTVNVVELVEKFASLEPSPRVGWRARLAIAFGFVKLLRWLDRKHSAVGGAKLLMCDFVRKKNKERNKTKK